MASPAEFLASTNTGARMLKDTTPLQRGIIRHLMIVIDLSIAMAEKDLRPTRYLLTLRYAIEFVTEFFEQNPISQLGIIGMRDGLAIRVSDMSGNPNDHITKLQGLRTQDPKGDASLQNALEMGRGALLSVTSLLYRAWAVSVTENTLSDIVTQPRSIPWNTRNSHYIRFSPVF